MNRRQFISRASALAPLALTRPLMPDTPPPTKLGIATTSYLSVWKPRDTFEFLEHCHSLGAAGIQSALNGDLPKIRATAERYGMYIEAMVSLPHGNDTAAFEQQLKDAQSVGAVALRTACLGTRRYETFTSSAQWQQHVLDSEKAIEAARPILDRYKIPLGIENHKDWTADEFVALLKRYANDYLGVCLDFGNNLSLLDGPMDVIEKLAPYAVSTHLKNMACEPYENGFLLSEVLLGDGYLDLPRSISLVRQARPNTRFSLEMITRDPLKVPCMTDEYWASFPGRSGIYLARTFRFVEHNSPRAPLPHISGLSHDEQLKLEEANVVACLNYVKEHLDL